MLSLFVGVPPSSFSCLLVLSLSSSSVFEWYTVISLRDCLWLMIGGLNRSCESQSSSWLSLMISLQYVLVRSMFVFIDCIMCLVLGGLRVSAGLHSLLYWLVEHQFSRFVRVDS